LSIAIKRDDEGLNCSGTIKKSQSG